jgi:peptidoglycan/LPS O-acetylase OafA/YrhL
MAATLIVLAKLFATALMAATCSNNFFAAKNTFCSNFVFLAATFVAAKNDISCSGWSLFVDYFFYFSLALYVLIVFTCSIIRDLTQTTPNELVHCHGQKCALNIR